MQKKDNILLQNIKILMPLFLLTILATTIFIACLKGTRNIAGVDYKFQFSDGHYFAFVALAINYLAFIFSRKFYPYVVATTLLLGLLNLINFLPSKQSFSLGFGDSEISFQPHIFFILITTCILNYHDLRSFLQKIFGDNKQEADKKLTDSEEKAITHFANKFKDQTDKQLEELINDERLRTEAITAAKSILEKRKTQTAKKPAANQKSEPIIQH
jgi:hypothetical protein